MVAFLHPQISPADVRRSASQGYLIIGEAPAAAVALVGKSLLEAGLIDVEGTYVCFIDCHDWSLVEVTLMASAVTGTIPVTLDRLYHNGQAMRDQQALAALSTSAQELVITDLRGSQRCRVTFVVGAGDDMLFAVGADQAAPDALAEFNGQ